MKYLGVLLLLATVASAQPLDPSIRAAQDFFDNGRFEEAKNAGIETLYRRDLTDAQRENLHRVVGLSAFNLGDRQTAEFHFLKVLTYNPDAQLDPFAVPQRAIKIFEDVRKNNSEALRIARQVRIMKSEKAAAEAEERRRTLLNADKNLLDRQSRDFLLAIPFGVPQFLQKRNGAGIAFAVVQAAMVIASVASFWTIYSMYQPYQVILTDRLGGTNPKDNTITVMRIPPSMREAYQVWDIVKWSSGGAFFGLWAVGSLEAYFYQQRAPVASPVPKVSISPIPNGAAVAFSFVF